MFCSNSPKFLERAYQLSIIINIKQEDIDANVLLIIGWAHYTEFFFMMVSVAIGGFCTMLIVKNFRMKIIHKNVVVIFYYGLALFFVHQMFRMVLFFAAFTCAVEGKLFMAPKMGIFYSKFTLL